jgi:hypothetical protein
VIIKENSNKTEAATARRNLYIFIAAVAVLAGLLAILTSNSPSGTSPTPSTVPASPTTTTTIAVTATPQEEATIASLSVAREATYYPASPTAEVTAADITRAAAPDKGTLIVVDNIGALPNYPRLVVFKWKFGGIPVNACVTIPRTRDLTPPIFKATPCPTGL